MQFEIADFFSAADYFDGPGAEDWSEIASILSDLRLQLQPTGEEGLVGEPNFDPKATNRILTERASGLGWSKIPVPSDLKSAFGSDWDAGKNFTLVEWQFSNYPFLWNNVIRSQVAARNSLLLRGMSGPPQALVVVTKSGCLPASRSTLYFEQAKAQMNIVLQALDLDIAIRLVGLTIPTACEFVEADWNTYPGRTARAIVGSTPMRFGVTWSQRQRVGHPVAKIHLGNIEAVEGKIF